MADTKWADIEAEEDFEPDIESKGFETKPDKFGIKTVTNYTKNIRGETVKVIKRVKIINKNQRINKAIYARSALVKFNLKGEEPPCVRPAEEYFIEVPRNTTQSVVKENDDDYYFGDLEARPAKDLKSKFKSLKEEEETPDKEKPVEVVETSVKYIPPNMRGGNYKTRDQQKEDCTVRVTNLSENVTEEDLQKLFSTAGKISRVYLAKHKETKSSKGFAFITYHDKDDAASAIKKLHRHGYDNLLLNVEWAKPAKDR